MLRMQNKAYDSLIVAHQLQASRVRFLPGNAFQLYMKSIGKLGGQHKLPRLSNNYELAAQLSASSIIV
ncbi:GH3 auxin-responsive promoter [compost metagenome]